MLKLQGQKPGTKWIGAAAGIAVIFLLMGYYLFPGEPEIDPQTAIMEGVKNTEHLISYKYSIKMTTNIDGKQEVISDIKGQRESSSRINFKGKIMGSEVDFYLIDSYTYYKDQLTGEWTKMNNDELNQQDIFMQEINPVASFRFRELSNAKFGGTEKLNGKECWIFIADASVNNPYMEILWKDFKCKFWLTPRNLLIQRALITAIGKNKPGDTLNLVVEMDDFNKGTKITPPK